MTLSPWLIQDRGISSFTNPASVSSRNVDANPTVHENAPRIAWPIDPKMLALTNCPLGAAASATDGATSTNATTTRIGVPLRTMTGTDLANS
jgi:hypothetical protein